MVYFFKLPIGACGMLHGCIEAAMHCCIPDDQSNLNYRLSTPLDVAARAAWTTTRIVLCGSQYEMLLLSAGKHLFTDDHLTKREWIHPIKIP
jgi:hypothetical protein